MWKLNPDSTMNEILITYHATKGFQQVLSPIFPLEIHKQQRISESMPSSRNQVTKTRPSAAITVSDFLSTGLKDVAYGIEVSLTALIDSKPDHLEQSEPGCEYLIFSYPMHKHAPNKNYICFNCIVERCFKRCTCEAKTVICKYCYPKDQIPKFSCSAQVIYKHYILESSKIQGVPKYLIAFQTIIFLSNGIQLFYEIFQISNLFIQDMTHFCT